MTHDPGAEGGRLRQILATLMAVAMCTYAAPALGQSATAPVLTAAFLFSFAKFTVWPSDALTPGEELCLCVVGDKGVRDALEQTIQGHAIDGRHLTVRIVPSDGSALTCHILYVSASEVEGAGALLNDARAAAILTVSDAEHFAESGGVVELVREKDRMRFTVNLAAATRSRLTLSSRLLSLANVVRR